LNCVARAGFYSTSTKKLKDEKTQSSSTKLKFSTNLLIIIAENKGNKCKNEVQLDQDGICMVKNDEKVTHGSNYNKII